MPVATLFVNEKGVGMNFLSWIKMNILVLKLFGLADLFFCFAFLPLALPGSLNTVGSGGPTNLFCVCM